jgi:CRISPR/Cas system-associated exonuclease Cas4 (RecB family)
MLSLCFYYNSKSINDLSYIENPDKETVIVAPSPVLADSIRSRVPSGTSVITISKFISDYFEFFNYDLEDRFKSKSELMKDLLMVWKIVNPELGFEQFKRSFNLFTDLRSFTVNSETIEAVLNEYDDVSRISVLAYYQFLNEQGYVEEHSRYYILSELLREYNVDVVEEKRNIIIMGFTFMSASQVDLIKAMGILHDVYIPFPKEVYENSIDSDWVMWIDKEHNIQTKDLDEKPELKNIKIHYHPKKGLSHAVTEICDGNNNEICLLSKNTTASELMAASISNSYFKTSIDLFENRIKDVFDNIEDIFYRDIDSIILGTKIIEYLKTKLSISLETKDILMLKPLTLALSTISKHIELNERNTELALIDLKVLKEVILLDAPRASLAVLNSDANSNKIIDISSIDEISGKGKVYLCINSDLGSIASSDKNYTETIETILFDMGPLKRAAFDFLLTKQKLNELLSEPNVEIICENGILDTDPYFNTVFSPYKELKLVIEENVHVEDHKPIKTDVISITKPELKTLSATRFQSYIECPRKYYLSSVEKVSLFLDFKTSIREVDLGRLEHKIIEDYFKVTDKWNEDTFKRVILDTLDKFYGKRDLNDQEKLSAEIEIYEYAKNGLDFLFELQQIEPGIKFIFEEPFNHKVVLEHIGRSDCIGLTENKLFIIDFKRSNSSVPKRNEILEFKKVQTWFYLNAINEKYGKTDLFVGYVCLADLSETVFVTNIDDKKYFPDRKIKYYPIKKFDEVFDGYKEFETTKVSELMNDEKFLIAPKDSKACLYCDFSNICGRGL